MIRFSKYLAIGLALCGTAYAQPPSTQSQAELRDVPRLLAMEEMKNLRLSFCRALDSHDWAALRATMTDDFELYFADNSGPNGTATRPPFVTKTADEFVELAKKLLSQGKSVHICTMPQFDYVRADQARAKWLVNGYGQIGTQNGMGFERLVDDYARVNGKWLIRKADARVEAQVLLPK